MHSPKVTENRLKTVIGAWSDLRPTKSFAGMTLAQFKTAIQPSLATRATIAEADNTRLAAVVQRDVADVASRAIIQQVVKGIVGDPAEGDDGELYKAMGYVRKSERASGLTQKSNAIAAQINATVTKTA